MTHYEQGYIDALNMCITEINRRIIDAEESELHTDADRHARTIELVCLGANLEGRRSARLEDDEDALKVVGA